MVGNNLGMDGVIFYSSFLWIWSLTSNSLPSLFFSHSLTPSRSTPAFIRPSFPRRLISWSGFTTNFCKNTTLKACSWFLEKPQHFCVGKIKQLYIQQEIIKSGSIFGTMKTQYRLNNVELISISNNSWCINMVLLLLLETFLTLWHTLTRQVKVYFIKKNTCNTWV